MHPVQRYSILEVHLESLGELYKMPMLGPYYAQGLRFKWSGVGPEHRMLLNSVQVNLTSSQSLEPLISPSFI